ncbi:cation transporter [Ruoffia tabacinasalis]|uniref:Cation transporter n=1 Tax=Ruoffia tabacinasalis TaxID=87458 RepID=A0A5R9DU25_9LACT|nr:cation diffusion facilitator family transporter [Ruoffia tabacinasalis]TLQ39738.1 cation transporter [Ruoffia tabacinasalis]
MKYQLVGIRNQDHANKLFNQIKQLPNKEQIHLNEEELEIEVEDITCYENLQRLLSYEKVGLKSLDYHEHEHQHSQEHNHSHDHSHDVDFTSGSQAVRNMMLVFGINIVFSVLEAIFGLLFNSASILADAVHDFGDALSIGLAWFFQKISLKGSDSTFSYGYKRYSLLGALITSVVLLVGSAVMIIHSGEKLMNPEPVNYQGMLILAIFAIIANGVSAWIISKGSSHNESILSLHLLEDVLGWVGVLVVSVVLHFTDWYFLDPLLSIGIALFILYKTIPEFMKVVRLFLQAVPDNIDSKKLREEIQNIDNINGLSHFHLWSLDGEAHMMSMTISTTSDSVQTHEQIKNEVRHILSENDIAHSNIEIVYDPYNILNSK